MKSNTATHFYLKEPQRFLLIRKLIPIPGVTHGPEAVRPEFELSSGTVVPAAHSRTMPVLGDAFTGVP